MQYYNWWKKLFDQPVKNGLRKYDCIPKCATGQGNDYATGFLLGYSYLKDYYKIIPIDLSKQQALDTGPKATPQINFTRNLTSEGNENTIMFLIIKEALS